MTLKQEAGGAALRKAAFDASPLRPGPLHGVRVLDMSRLVAGNMLSLQLADFGADVIKIEAAGAGDTLRQWRERHADYPDGFDGWWQVYARNKRSVSLNLRSEAARSILLGLVDQAQILIESFRPGTLENMGLAPASLHERNPKLVIVRISGWGQSGPYRELPGFGSLIEGFCGYAEKNGYADKPPFLPNMALADMVTGLSGAFATMAALREVEMGSGKGQVVDLSLLEPMVAIMGPDAAVFAATGAKPDRMLKIASPRGVFRCRDGSWVAMSGSTDAMARRVFEAIGQAHLFDDPKFSTNHARLANDDEINRLIQDFIGTLDQPACLALFREKGVTVGPIHDVEHLLQDAHVVARGVYVETQAGPQAPPVVMHNVSPTLSATPGSLRTPAPRRGQHTAALLAGLGMTQADIDSLHAQGDIECE
jgi:crotonobetainyl-CoA:carnitine CoA-transferase CaiB-like acyl-CoA transferase